MIHPTHGVVALLATVCILSLGGAATHPADQTRDDAEKAAMAAGRAEAKKDLAAGRLCYRQPLPESFLISWMGGEDAHLLDYYEAILTDRMGVTHETVMFHAASPVEERCRAQGYNQVMVPLIEKRFGADVLDKAWKETCDLPDAKIAAYLKSRPKHTPSKPGPATQPTSRPAAAKKSPGSCTAN